MKNLIKVLALISTLSQLSCSRDIYPDEPKLTTFQTNQEPAHKSGGSGAERTVYVAVEIPYNHNASSKKASSPLANGFAHNDYLHKHPLYDALENGFTNIEADIFLENDKLIVAHFFPWFKGDRTLESLYLQPLLKRTIENDGEVFAGYNHPVTLLIDIKTNAVATYAKLKPLLEKYKSILTGYENGKVVYRAVTIVLSGNKPYQAIENEKNRLAFIDEDLCKVPCDQVNDNVFTMASCRYSRLIKWNGNGPITDADKNTLCALVIIAHKMGAKVRLWASPENTAVWAELLSCGVDLINTDELVTFKNYLVSPNFSAVTHRM
ncbi:MAG TPA: phosphatidylinositol-specific phospholipase C/glycerophosphodiester phosphodiesterase family protein [Mucilaginibacter sp.]|jgi:hypothetical protein